MRRAQLPLPADRRHTLPAPHLFGNQPAPLRPCIPASFSLRHRATLLCDDHLPQDAVHVAPTEVLLFLPKPKRYICPQRPFAKSAHPDNQTHPAEGAAGAPSNGRIMRNASAPRYGGISHYPAVRWCTSRAFGGVRLVVRGGGFLGRGLGGNIFFWFW